MPSTPSPKVAALLSLGLLLCCLALLALAIPHPASAGQATDQNPKTAKHPTPNTQHPAPGLALPSDAPQPQLHAPDRTGGPDAYGYVFADDRDPGGPSYNWQPGVNRVSDDAWARVSGGAQGPLDDGVVTTTLPFAFNFYGTSYTSMHISTNGNVHFGAPNDYWPGATHECLPSSSGGVPQAMLAPLWFDFIVPDSPSGLGGVYTDIIGTSPNRTFVVEWRGAYDFNQHSTTATFEALVSESGDMTFQYMSLNGSGVNGSGGVIGIQNANGAIGLPYSCYVDSVVPERAIRYQLQRGVIISPQIAQRGGAPGATLTYSHTLANQTGIDNSFTIAPSGNVWTTTVQPANTGAMPRGSSITVTVQVQIPPNAPIGANDVARVNVSSALPTPGAFTATAVLTSSVSSYGVDFNPPNQQGAAAFGSPVTYTAALINRSGQNNTFQIAATGNAWTTTFTPTQTGVIAPDASTPITVSVLVPANSTLGARDVVTITATGQQPEPGRYFGVTVITTTAGIWERKASAPMPRSRQAAVSFAPNGRIYIVGGEDNNGNTDLPIEEYEPLGNTWTDRAHLQVGVSNVGAATIGNAVYVPGGYDGSTGTVEQTLQAYYPDDDRTQVIATDPLPAPRFGAGVTALNGKLYVIGGSASSLVGKNTVYEYDPSRPAGSRWQTKAPMPTARVYLGAATLNGVIYAVGGMPGQPTDLAIVEAYNPNTDSWTTRHPMSRGRAGLALIGVDSDEPGCGGYLYALGGGYTAYTATAERYDPAADAWGPISSLLLARRTLAAVHSHVSHALLAFGGWNGQYDDITEAIRCDSAPLPPAPTPLPTSTPTPSIPCPTFSDVPPSNPFYSYIMCLYGRGIVSGYNDCTFHPGDNVTRGQLAKIVSNSANFNDPIPTSQESFSDVPSTQPFWLYIERLYLHGAISGYNCGGPNEPCDPQYRPYFRPGNSSTRGQISKIVSTAANFSDPVPSTQQSFSDVPSTQPFWLYIERLYLHGAISGYNCGGPNEPCDPQYRPYFRPGNSTTRGQVSKIVTNSFFPGCNP